MTLREQLGEVRFEKSRFWHFSGRVKVGIVIIGINRLYVGSSPAAAKAAPELETHKNKTVRKDPKGKTVIISWRLGVFA